MSSYQELVSILKEILTNRFYPKPEFIKGLLGDGLGNVLVPGRPDYNYVRFNRSANETFEVFNKEISQPVDGTPVLIGTLPWQPGLVQVIGIDWESYIQTGWGDTYASIQAHASTHEWPDFAPGSDFMSAHHRSIYPMRGYGGGTGSMSFTARPYQYDYTGTNHYWPGTPTIDLGPTRPATGTMRYMGVYLNPATNTLGAVTGATTAFVQDAEPSYPAWPLNVYPVAFARVYGGQAYFIERDIKDARRLWNTTLIFTGTSSGGGTAIWPAPNKLKIGTTEYSTLAAAVAAAVSGDTIYAGVGSFTSDDVTLPSGVNLVGADKDATIFLTTSGQNTLQLGGSNYVANVTIKNTANSTSERRALRINTTGSTCFNCEFIITNADTGDTRAVLADSAAVHTNYLISCKTSATGGGTDYGVFANSSSALVVYLLNCYIQGDTASIAISSNATIQTVGTMVSGGAVSAPVNGIRGTFTTDTEGVLNIFGTNSLIQQHEVGAPGTSPLTNFWYKYFDTNGLHIKEDTGVDSRVLVGNMDSQNLAINGSLSIWQRGTSFAAVTDGQSTADTWKWRQPAGSGAFTVSQSADVPTVAEAGILAPYSILVDCTTADATIAAADLYTIGTRIEGFDWAQVAQRSFVISFWVKSTKTGTFCVSIRNSGADRSYVGTYTINTTATWEYKTVVVTASPSAGTWNYTNGIGATIEWAIAAGSNYHTTAGAWQTGSFLATSGQVNGADSTSNDFRLALVDVLPGTYDRLFPIIDYQKILSRCQRYLYLIQPENGNNQGQGAKLSTTVIALQFRHPVTMRIAATLSHNITGYTAGVPGTTTVGIVDYARNAFFAITGALTVALGAGGLDFSNITFTAGTSWDGTAGNLGTLRVGPSVVAVLSSEL